jgi:hypothetical protein
MIHSAGSPAVILVEKDGYWGKGSEPNARFMGRKERDPSRGSPRFLMARSTLVRNDNLLRKCLLTGELDLTFGFRGGAVAESRTITPGADRIEDGSVFGWTCAFKDQSGVHPAIGANDEADANLGARVGNVEQRIRSG